MIIYHFQIYHSQKSNMVARSNPRKSITAWFEKNCLKIAQRNPPKNLWANEAILLTLPLMFLILGVSIWHFHLKQLGLVISIGIVANPTKVEFDASIFWYGFILIIFIGLVLLTVTSILMIRGFRFLGRNMHPPALE